MIKKILIATGAAAVAAGGRLDDSSFRAARRCREQPDDLP